MRCENRLRCLPDLFVLGSASDVLASCVVAAAERQGIHALLCSRYEYSTALTVSVRASEVRVIPDRPVLVRQHLGDRPTGPDSRFLSKEVYAHVMGGLALLRRTVVNRPRIHGPAALVPPVMALYQLLASGALPCRASVAPEVFCDGVRVPVPGREMQDMHTWASCVCGEETRSDTPQRLRRTSPDFTYLSVLVVGARAWLKAGETDPRAATASAAAVEIAGRLGLQLAEVTFKSTEAQDLIEVAKIDANPLCFETAPVIQPAAEALIDLLLAS